MTSYDFSLALMRLAAISSDFVGSEADKTKTPLGAELWRRFSGISSETWNLAISWIIDHHQTRSAPTQREFIAAYDAVRPLSKLSDVNHQRSPEDHLDWLRMEADKMGPAGAAYVLGQIEVTNIDLPPDIRETLIEKASRYVEPKPVLSAASTAEGATTPPAIEDDAPPPEE